MITATYNGYTNYETWAVSLWLDNDRYLYSHYLRLAKGTLNTPQGIANLAGIIKDEIQENNPCADRMDVFADFMNAALGEVNWAEIAENMITEGE